MAKDEQLVAMPAARCSEEVNACPDEEKRLNSPIRTNTLTLPRAPDVVEDLLAGQRRIPRRPGTPRHRGLRVPLPVGDELTSPTPAPPGRRPRWAGRRTDQPAWPVSWPLSQVELSWALDPTAA